MKDCEGTLWLFPEFAPKPKAPKPRAYYKQYKKTQQKKKPFPKHKFSELDKEFWKAQDDWETASFSLKSKAWATMWIRVQHAVYNIIFRKLMHYREQSEIESMSHEISSNIMQGFLKKVKNNQPWKVKAPVAGYCSMFCMRIYADSFKREDEELSLEMNDGDGDCEQTSFMAVKRTNNGFYREVNEYELERDDDGDSKENERDLFSDDESSRTY